jgi:peptide/nickel transport system substrate-binding protein
MRCIASLSLAGTSLLVLGALAAEVLTPSAGAATRPRYGGTLRIELQTASVTFDPRRWQTGSAEAAAGEQLGALVLDRLVSLDNHGRFQPQLAIEWTHDAAFKRWQFTLRPGVKFAEGTPLTSAEVAAALQLVLPQTRQVLASGNAVVLQSAEPLPDLLEELASGRNFIFRVQADGSLAGTGPFVLDDPSKNAPSNPGVTGSRLSLRANEECWSGRPFLDAIQVTLGVPAARQLYDLQLGQADLVELPPDLFHHADDAHVRTWSSRPVELIALVLDGARPAVQDARLREALSFAIDRSTMAGVLLQKQAEPAAALLPGWLSGYAFLFPMETNIERAKELRAALPAGMLGTADPLRLGVDAAGDVARLLAERVAVNARQAGLNLQVLGRGTARTPSSAASNATPSPDVRLIRWRVSSLAPRDALDSLTTAFHVPEGSGAASSSDPEQLYQRERALLDTRFVIPLVYLPESVALGASVRDWIPSPWGEWHLEDVWLDRPATPAPPVPAPGSARQPSGGQGVHP